MFLPLFIGSCANRTDLNVICIMNIKSQRSAGKQQGENSMEYSKTQSQLLGTVSSPNKINARES